MAQFSELGVSPQLLTILTAAGFTEPTPIQSKAIPLARTGKDIIGIAQTGTGKTLAFGIPVIEQLVSQRLHRALMVVPTRELALQVEESLMRLTRPIGMQTVVLIGGAPLGDQIRRLRSAPQIIIGTPGRIIDHLERRSLDLRNVKHVVLDEADRMLDMGFAPQIRTIMDTVPTERQTLLFSATMPADIVRIAQKYMQLPLRVEIAPAGTTATRVTQELFFVKKEQKLPMLSVLLKEYTGSVLVFSRTKHGAKKMARSLYSLGHTATDIHSNRTLAQRKEALAGFKTGKYRVLVATDIAARGIDVTGIEVVVNYDMPENPEDYVHRIGRTGRAGKEGHAITFVQPDQRHKVRQIEQLVRNGLKVSAVPELPNLPQSEPRPERYEAPAVDRPTWGRSYGTQRPAGQGPRHRRRTYR